MAQLVATAGTLALSPFEQLAQDGYSDVPYDQVMRWLKCSKCGGRKLSVTLHGNGVSPPDAKSRS